MQEATLPSPDMGANGYHLRRIAAKAISALEVIAPNYPDGAHPGAEKLEDFFLACAAAAATVGKQNAELEVSPESVEGEPSDTQQLTATTGGSDGTVSYLSTDTQVATVSGAGLVTLVDVGTASIVVSLSEGTDHRAASVVVPVTVTEAEEE